MLVARLPPGCVLSDGVGPATTCMAKRRALARAFARQRRLVQVPSVARRSWMFAFHPSLLPSQPFKQRRRRLDIERVRA